MQLRKTLLWFSPLLLVFGLASCSKTSLHNFGEFAINPSDISNGITSDNWQMLLAFGSSEQLTKQIYGNQGDKIKQSGKLILNYEDVCFPDNQVNSDFIFVASKEIINFPVGATRLPNLPVYDQDWSLWITGVSDTQILLFFVYFGQASLGGTYKFTGSYMYNIATATPKSNQVEMSIKIS